MARRLRIQFKGAIYHVTVRGVDRRRLFDDDADRQRFLLRLGESADEQGVRLYLFCCLSNHVHLLCETPRANLSAFMHSLQTAYSVYYNRRHQRVGHLMQGRFGATLVSGDPYLLTLSRYIHLNPIADRPAKSLSLTERIGRLRAYRWSSYRGYAGLATPYDWMDEAPILGLTGASSTHGQRRAYRRYVEAGIAETDEEFNAVLKTSRWGIGDAAFQARVRALHADRVREAKRPEDASFRRAAESASVAEVLEAVARGFGVPTASLRQRQYDCPTRAAAAFMLARHAGMNQREIAALLGLGTGSAVSHQLRGLREQQTHDAALNERLARIGAVLRDANR